jgi:hypothetical protein
MRLRFFRRLFPAVLLAAAALAASGCGRALPASASGQVTLNGAPLKGPVLLTFIGPDSTPRSTQTDPTGVFNISGLAVGETRVTIVSIPEGGPAVRELSRGTPGAPPSRPVARPAASRSEIPAEYGNAAEPRVTFTLQDGDNPVNIELRSSPR